MIKTLRISTLNLKGLGNIITRKRIEGLLNKDKTDIVFLQETHQSKEGANELKLGWSGIYEKTFGTSRLRGVAMIIARNCEFKVEM